MSQDNPKEKAKVKQYIKSKNYDEVITIAGNISNIIFDLLPALKANQIKASILVIDDPPSPVEVRARIFKGIGDGVRFIGKSRMQAFQQSLSLYIKAKRENRKPIIVLPSLSHPSTVIGNTIGFVEMVNQMKRQF